MTRLTKSTDKSWRTGIYLLLGLLVTLGVGLSLATAHMVAEVQRTSSALLEDDVPRLERLAAFKSALLLHENALDNYFSRAIDAQGFNELELYTLGQMDLHYRDLAAGLTDDEARSLHRAYGRVAGMGAALRSAVERRPADVREARKVLAALHSDTTTIRTVADGARVRLEERLRNSGRMAMDRSGRIANLVHFYIGFALLGALFLVVQVRARLKTEDVLSYLAAHDEMTRLPHRWSFLERVRRLSAHDRHLVLVEADRFDRVVAGIGPQHADELVQVLAQRTAAVAHAVGAEVFRLGDNKFALLLQERGAASAPVSIVAARLQSSIADPMLVGKHEIYVSASVASAELNPAETGFQSGLRNAEAALHQARHAGGAAYVAYSRQLDDRSQQHLAMEADLRHAIERGELELYYQPQQRLRDGALVGFEALLRWKRGDTFISPAEFVPLAEQSGLIGALGDWVIAQACRQARLWNPAGAPPIGVAINISPRQFAQPRFLERFRTHLLVSGAPVTCVELEITEGMLMESADRSAELLTQLRALGVRLSVDDFGTGYSSLAYLKRFPLHKLKIDQAFVRHLRPEGDDAEIVKAVVGLGHNLGFSVIAEGVETAEQAALLAAWKCDQIQGYHYGRPMPAAAATAFLARQDAPVQLEA